jgi:hypothetical protein
MSPGVVWWWCGGGVVVVWWWCGGFLTDNNTTPTKVVLSCFGLLVGLWQLRPTKMEALLREFAFWETHLLAFSIYTRKVGIFCHPLVGRHS